jgi:transposase
MNWVGSGRHALVHDRHDLTNDEWAQLEPLLPGRPRRRGGQWVDHRRVIDGVMWRTRTGSPWRDLPASYGNWKTVYNRHRRWSADGTWERILDGLRTGADEVDAEEWRLSIDATVIRAHHHAAGARHAPPKDVPAERLAPTALEVAERARGRAGGWVELQGFRRLRLRAG